MKQLATWKKNTVNLQLLPTPVDPEEAEEMFDFADKNKDSKIGWEEFQVLNVHFYFYFSFQFQFYKNQGFTNWSFRSFAFTFLTEIVSLLFFPPVILSW